VHHTATRSRRRTAASREVRASLCVGADDASHEEITGSVEAGVCHVSVRLGEPHDGGPNWLYRWQTVLWSIHTLTPFGSDTPFFVDAKRGRAWRAGKRCRPETEAMLLDCVGQLLAEVEQAARDEAERDADAEFRREYEQWLDMMA
jgi:hypothetical protein